MYDSLEIGMLACSERGGLLRLFSHHVRKNMAVVIKAVGNNPKAV
jgi:hypothetical protein